MTTLIDRRYFRELAGKDPEDVCERALCRYDSKNKVFTLSVWGEDYAIYPQESKIENRLSGSREVYDYLGLFIIHYLLRSKKIELDHEWISEKDIPGGVTFYRGPHAIPTDLISKRYNNYTKEFRKRCEQLYGIPLDMADAAYRFDITARIPVAVLFWAGDNEFPPESKILFDKTIIQHLAPDIIFALAVEICHKIEGR